MTKTEFFAALKNLLKEANINYRNDFKSGIFVSLETDNTEYYVGCDRTGKSEYTIFLRLETTDKIEYYDEGYLVNHSHTVNHVSSQWSKCVLDSLTVTNVFRSIVSVIEVYKGFKSQLEQAAKNPYAI